MKKTNPYRDMPPTALATAAILQSMELQLKAAKVLLIGRPTDKRGLRLADDIDEANGDVVASVLKVLETPAARRLAAPPPEKVKSEPSTKGMDNFGEVPETTAKIVVAMSGSSWLSIPKIAEAAGVSRDTVRRYLYKVLLPNQMARAGTGDNGHPAYRKVIANTRKIE